MGSSRLSPAAAVPLVMGARPPAAILGKPWGVAVDSSSNLYFSGFLFKFGPQGHAGWGNYYRGRRRLFLGNGGPATGANLTPLGVAVDPGGNLFIADTGASRIRKVTPDGTISTVAGNESYNYSGDGGPATNAAVNGPGGVAVDAAGNIYISYTGNYRIRLVTPDGTINTIAGNGSPNSSGDGGPALGAGLRPAGIALGPGGVVYVGDAGVNNRVRLLTPSSGP